MADEETAGFGIDACAVLKYVRRIGAGGFGEVYLAHMYWPATKKMRAVAVKFAHTSFAEAAAAPSVAMTRRLFSETHSLVNEATAANRVGRHMNIAEILALRAFGIPHEGTAALGGDGREGPQLCLVSEFVEGPTIVSVLRNAPANRAKFVRQIAAGLAHLHKHNVVHGDLHAGNVLYDKVHRRVKLIDFGMATAFEPGRCASQLLWEWRLVNYRIQPPEFYIPMREWLSGRLSKEATPAQLREVHRELESAETDTVYSPIPSPEAAAEQEEASLARRGGYLAPRTLATAAALPRAFFRSVMFSDDIWAFGLMLFEILTGELFHARVSGEFMLEYTAKMGFVHPRRLASSGLGEIPGILSACMQTNPAARPSAQDIATKSWSRIRTEGETWVDVQ